MATAPSLNAQLRPLIVLAYVVVGVVVLYTAQTVLIPIALATLIAFILAPLVTGLQRRGLKRVFAVLLVTVLGFSCMGLTGWVVTAQVNQLATDVNKKADLAGKVKALQSGGGGFFKKYFDIGATVAEALKPAEPEEPRAEPLHVVVDNQEPSGVAVLSRIAGPLLEPLATAGLVVVLVLFMLMWREDLRNRIFLLLGHGRLTRATKALDDAGQRISRFLLMQLTVNACFGLALSVGLLVLGVPSPFLWGVLAGALRFIPYLGTWLAAAFPLVISFVTSETSPVWLKPVEVLGVFLALELVTFNVVEPLLFSHSTGVSPVALLVAAAFWTWLWGPIGLLLSTPLTSCLVVLGKYVPNLEFLDVLLGDEPALDPKFTYYQRLLARDPDEAADVVEEHLKTHPLPTVYDDVLLPAVVRARRDAEEDLITPEEEEFVYQVTGDVLSELVATQQQIHQIATTDKPLADAKDEPTAVIVVGCPAQTQADGLAVAMFAQLVETTRCHVDIIPAGALAAEVVMRVQDQQPALVFIAALPPGGLARTRYLCKRLRSQCPDLKIAVCRWGARDSADKAVARLKDAGADFVAFSLAESREQVVPFIQLAKHVQPAPREPQPAKA